MAGQVKCVICLQVFTDNESARQRPCSGGKHILQELIDGARNHDFVNGETIELKSGERTDFIPVDENDLKRWADAARKLGYTIDD